METVDNFNRFKAKIDHCDFEFAMTDSLRRRVVNETSEFEECHPRKEELSTYSDTELAQEYYRCCLDYARGQGLI